MNALHDMAINASTFASPSGVDDAASDFAVRPHRAAQTALRSMNWGRRSEQWGCLMVAAQGGENEAYEILLREIGQLAAPLLCETVRTVGRSDRTLQVDRPPPRRLSLRSLVAPRRLTDRGSWRCCDKRRCSGRSLLRLFGRKFNCMSSCLS